VASSARDVEPHPEIHALLAEVGADVRRLDRPARLHDLAKRMILEPPTTGDDLAAPQREVRRKLNGRVERGHSREGRALPEIHDLPIDGVRQLTGSRRRVVVVHTKEHSAREGVV
jgi:hypothetical protein